MALKTFAFMDFLYFDENVPMNREMCDNSAVAQTQVIANVWLGCRLPRSEGSCLCALLTEVRFPSFRIAISDNSQLKVGKPSKNDRFWIQMTINQNNSKIEDIDESHS